MDGIVVDVVQAGWPVALFNPLVWVVGLVLAVIGQPIRMVVAACAATSAICASILTRLPMESLPELVADFLRETSSFPIIVGSLVCGFLLSLVIFAIGAGVRQALQKGKAA